MYLNQKLRLMEELRQQFKDNWSKEYLHQLHQRSRDWKLRPNRIVEYLVLVHMGEQGAPLHWILVALQNIFWN